MKQQKLRRLLVMTGAEVSQACKTYSLQSWSKQGNIAQLPIEKAEGIYFWD